MTTYISLINSNKIELVIPGKCYSCNEHLIGAAYKETWWEHGQIRQEYFHPNCVNEPEEKDFQ